MNKKQYKTVIIILLCMLLVACDTQESLSLQEALSTEDDFEMEVSTETVVEEVDTTCYVYVCGAVVSPGVYELLEGDRKVQAIELAGGFLEEAATESINLAEPVTDGMQITVATKEELALIQLEEELLSSGMINLNTASIEQLCSLTGIGESKATDIIEYREQTGAFSSIEEVKNISGIGDSVYEGIKDFIYVDG